MEKTSVFELPNNLARQVPVDEVNSPYLTRRLYRALRGLSRRAVECDKECLQVTKNVFMSDRLEGEDTANSTIFRTPNVSIAVRWFAAWQLENTLRPGHRRNTWVWD